MANAWSVSTMEARGKNVHIQKTKTAESGATVKRHDDQTEMNLKRKF